RVRDSLVVVLRDPSQLLLSSLSKVLPRRRYFQRGGLNALPGIWSRSEYPTVHGSYSGRRTGEAAPVGAPVVTELRCQCLQTLQGIHPKNIRSVNVKFPGPHCAQTEVITALKNGQKVCLNPTAPMVQKIIQKMLNSGNANGPREEKAYPLQFLKESILRGIKVKEEKQLAPGHTWTVFNVFNCFL
uniref:C-X-C motif chemokine n=1 Tax=Macaca fascicularis TaxID=9541 RepID=A0A7N9CSR1_MACFA